MTSKPDGMTGSLTDADALLLTPPSSLAGDEAALAHWQELAPRALKLGTLDSDSREALAMLCELRTQVTNYRRIVARDSPRLERGGVYRSHPLARPLANAQISSLKLLKSFGLTPAGKREVLKRQGKGKYSRSAGATPVAPGRGQRDRSSEDNYFASVKRDARRPPN